VYRLPDGLQIGIVVIRNLSETSDTLWLRSNSKFRNSEGVRHWWFALTPALSQVWEREQETKLFDPAPLLPDLGEGWGEGEGAGMHSTGLEFGIAGGCVA
jgi:hypothetical protein